MGSFLRASWLTSMLLYADDLFLVLHDVGFYLEHISGGIRPAPHKRLATTLGLDQLIYAV